MSINVKESDHQNKEFDYKPITILPKIGLFVIFSINQFFIFDWTQAQLMIRVENYV